MDWQEDYKKKLITAEEAAGMIKSGDRIGITLGEPIMALHMLGARLDELEDLEIHGANAMTDYAYLQPEFEKTVKIVVESFVHPIMRPLTDERRADYSPVLYSLEGKAEAEGRPGVRGTDIFFVVISPPDEHGFCTYGSSMWAKKWYTKNAKKVIAQVDNNQIRCYGDCRVHVSEIDYFVEHTTELPDMSTPAAKQFLEPTADEAAKTIGAYIGTLVKDGDTFGIGHSKIGVTLCGQGIFDDRHDLGYYSENIVPGVAELVRKGVITGKRKSFHPGVPVVVNNLADRGNSDFINNNPMFELYPQNYILNIRNVAANDNMVAINSTLAIDFTGQIASESIGHQMHSGSGGQPELAIGAMLSKGGRSITLLRSTTSDGKISRITPSLEPGTIVTVPRNFADYVVTEYGIACLYGKTQRERSQELVAIAHPDFRAELEKQAQELFWP